jgi:hypothetical protein
MKYFDIHDIELTGGIETSIRGAREQLTISRKNVNANTKLVFKWR